MNPYEDQAAKCPFYRKYDTPRKRIVCEGIADYCKTALCFGADPSRMEWHKREYCDKSYRYCEIYNMLEQKYSED